MHSPHIENYMREEKIRKCKSLYGIQMKELFALIFWSLQEFNENSRQHWRRSTGIWPILFERACGLENENETFFVELWHVCDTKSCVKKFGGGNIN